MRPAQPPPGPCIPGVKAQPDREMQLLSELLHHGSGSPDGEMSIPSPAGLDPNLSEGL